MQFVKRAVITGGSSGLGLAFAQTLAGCGTALVLVARGEGGLVESAHTIRARIPSAVVQTFAADVTDAAALARVVQETRAGGDIDLLLNCAGVLREGRFESLYDSDFREQMEINYFGTLNAIRAFLPSLVRCRGRIVNVSSLSGVTGIYGYSGYCASKFAVQGLSESLRVELRSRGVAVHAVCPGEFESPMVDAIAATRSAENIAHTSTVPRVTTDVVVGDTLRGISRGTFLIVPGRVARLAEFGSRHFPALNRRLGDWRVARAGRRPDSKERMT